MDRVTAPAKILFCFTFFASFVATFYAAWERTPPGDVRHTVVDRLRMAVLVVVKERQCGIGSKMAFHRSGIFHLRRMVRDPALPPIEDARTPWPYGNPRASDRLSLGVELSRHGDIPGVALAKVICEQL